MKISRLFAYAAAGVIAGLLIENKALIARQYAGAKTHMLKKKAGKVLHHNN
jgi:hypothetical protein